MLRWDTLSGRFARSTERYCITKSSTEPSLKDQIEILRNENATLLQKLKLSEEYSAEVSQRKTELEFEVSNLQDAINASNSIISNYQQEIQQWTSTVKYYEAYCHQCTDELNQVISSLQRLKDCFAPIMCGELQDLICVSFLLILYGYNENKDAISTRVYLITPRANYTDVERHWLLTMHGHVVMSKKHGMAQWSVAL
ncbi:hypothetical protein BDV24DRAFT_156721 [Aspergillus arachidicola]|uniref:Uncharacterized protein n=1 Tax=Aspergillus arachidicola TaxID=656916 RepID=A0A5N6XMZ9_9EURO|nr:hypothetical protein BDV24DRAFT_156721 [Aspergillus arachidicola]